MRRYTKPDSLIIPGITFNDKIKGIHATLIAGHFDREDSEYYFENPVANRDNRTNYLNKKAQNMDSRTIDNLFPPSMNEDLD